MLSGKPIIEDLPRKLRLAVRVCRLNCSLSMRFFEFCYANMERLTAVKEIEEEDIASMMSQGKEAKERFSKDMFDANSLFIKTTGTMSNGGNSGNNSNSKTKSTNIVVNHNNTNSSAANAAVATTSTTTTATNTNTTTATSQLSDRLREASRSLEGFLHKKIKLNDSILAVVGGAILNSQSVSAIPAAGVSVVPTPSVLLSITNTKLSEEG